MQAHKFCDGDINKFYLMLRKRVCPYEYMHFKASNLNGWSLSQKLPVNNFEWQNNISKFDEDFVISNSQNGDKGCILEVDVECSKELHDVHYDLPYLSERMKSNTKSFERTLKEALNHGLVFKKLYRVIKFDQDAWLKWYIDMKTELRKKAKSDFEKKNFSS